MTGEYLPLVLLTGVFALIGVLGFAADYRARHPRRSSRSSDFPHGSSPRAV
jgi:hypothetical protein